jgi:outer membrane protein insertion porin family
VRKKNLTFALVSMIFGALLGIGIIVVKVIIKKELVAMLDDMARRGAGCSFEYDRINISLSTLKARAYNPRIVCEGRAMFGFKELEAKFGLKKIRENEVMLKSLKLTNGFSVGALADSPTFKFIDFLVAPIPPERDYPGRWKMRLYNLELRRGSFTEQLGDARLVGRGIALDLDRTTDNNFILKPKINRLAYKTNGETSAALSAIMAEIGLYDDKVTFKDISLLGNQNPVHGQLELDLIPNKNLKGVFDADISSANIKLPFNEDSQFKADLTLEGPPDALKASGSLKNVTSPISLSGSDLVFENLSTKLEISTKDGDLSISVSPEGDGPGVLLDTKTPIIISEGKVAGDLNLNLDGISGSGISAYGITSSIRLSGTLKDPNLNIKASAKMIGLLDTYLADIESNITSDKNGIAIDLIDTKKEFNLTANLSSPENGVRTIKAGSFSAKVVPLFRRSLLGEMVASPLALTANGTLSGALQPKSIKFDAKADVIVLQKNIPLVNIVANIDKGKVKLIFSSTRGDIEGNATLDLAADSGSVLLNFNKFSPQEFDSKAQCAQLTGALDYKYRSGATTGYLDIKSASLGCEPYTLTLVNPQVLTIANDLINLGNLKFAGQNSYLELAGSFGSQAGFNLQARGLFNLHTLAPMFPALDDLKGDIEANLTVVGPTDSPKLTGSASIKNGVVSTYAADLTVDDISGHIKLDGRKIIINNFFGAANDGAIQISGSVDLDSPTNTEVTAELTDIFIQPLAGANIWASGNLNLKTDENEDLAVNGDILIARGDVERTITLRSLIRGLLTTSSKTIAPTKSELGNIQLNINIDAPRNLFLMANWADLEMKGNLKVGGTIKEPLLNGEIETLSGWFGLNTRRFSIASGKFLISYPAQEPFIDITAETQMSGTTGETVLVMLDVTGPLSAPQVKFSSDSGLSSQELTKIIAKGGFAVSGSIVDVVAGGDKEGSARNNFMNFLKRITDIDSLGIEPGYNERTGTVEPILVAEKSITSKIKVVGKNSFSAESRQSSIFGALQLTPSLTFLSGLENLPLEEVAAYSADLKYSVLKSQKDFLKILVFGNENVSTDEILEGIRLTTASRLPKDEATKFSASISNLYKNKGYFSSIAEINCQDDSQFCRTLTISIQEGPATKITSIEKEGDNIESFLKKLTLPKIGTLATKSAIKDLKNNLTRAVRSEGYIAAVIKTSYTPSADGKEATLIIQADLGDPYTFIFTGNRLHSAADFLDTINLFKRSQPFGDNTPAILLENIEKLYREAGYLYVTIDYDQLPPDKSGRKIHNFKIDEGTKISVKEVRLDSPGPFSLKEYASHIADGDKELKNRFLRPQVALQEEIDGFAELMISKLKEAGYPRAFVSGAIIDHGENGVDIVYEVRPDNPVHFAGFEVSGLPEGVLSPSLPAPPLSVPQINRATEEIITNLRQEGYKSAEIFSNTGETFNLTINPGERSKIGKIEIIGNQRVETATIISFLKIKEGDPLREERLDHSKRHLLSLGLFSRVDILPADGVLDSATEDLVIKVEEKNLRSLDLGAGYNSAYGPHLFSEYIDRKIFADGRTLGLRFDTYHEDGFSSITRGTVSLRYMNPFFYGEQIRLTEDLRYQKLENGILPYDLDRLSLLSFLDFTKFSNFKATLGHTLMAEDLTNVEPDAVISDLDNGRNLLSIVSGAITFDKRNDALLPTDGYFLGADTSISDSIIGSDANYAGLGVRGSAYIPLNKEGTVLLANNLRFGALVPYGDTSEIPISQRFFLGGHNTVRGFRENSIGPKGSEGSPIGGDVMGYGNFELQYNLTDYLQLASFFDAGTTFLQSDGFSTSDIRESAGGGTRVLTPLGAISLYAGFPLDEQRGDPSVRFHFNIGAQF